MHVKRRVVVFGIDGATFDLMQPWIAEGKLPNLARMAKNGASGELQSTLPPNSPAAWTSFMTGVNPGKHGVYGFTRVEPRQGYSIKVNSGATRHAQTVWQYLSQQGRRSIVINVPMTYPPDRIDGIVVSGINTPGLESQFTHPPELRDKVFEWVPDYVLDVRAWGVETTGERRAQLFDNILHMMDARARLMARLLTTEPWDMFTIVFTATDRAMHFFWRFLDPAHPLHDPQEAPKYQDAILSVYQRVDEVLGDVMAYCGEDVTLIVMSDHGFGPQHTLFRINQWLLENGHLQLTNRTQGRRLSSFAGGVQDTLFRGLDGVYGRARLLLSDTAKDRLKRLVPWLRERVVSQFLFAGVDWSNTVAYHTAEFPGSIRVNLKGREVEGIVEPGVEYDRVCQDIRSALEEYVDPYTGKRLVERVFKRGELYWGPSSHLAPDLVVHLADYGYTIDWNLGGGQRGSLGELPVIDRLTGAYASNCGSHRLNGILMLQGQNVREGAQLDRSRIYDVVPTVLYLLDLPIPTELDGHVLTAALKPELLNQQPVEEGTSDLWLGNADSADRIYSQKDEDAVTDRLNRLGYL